MTGSTWGLKHIGMSLFLKMLFLNSWDAITVVSLGPHTQRVTLWIRSKSSYSSIPALKSSFPVFLFSFAILVMLMALNGTSSHTPTELNKSLAQSPRAWLQSWSHFHLQKTDWIIMPEVLNHYDGKGLGECDKGPLYFPLTKKANYIQLCRHHQLNPALKMFNCTHFLALPDCLRILFVNPSEPYQSGKIKELGSYSFFPDF